MILKRQRAYLADASPQQGLLDVGSRLVVPTQEPRRWLGGISLGSGMEIRKDGQDIRVARDIGRVRGGPDQQKVVAEGVVDGLRGNALVHGDLLGRRIVRDADVDQARLEVLDAVGRVARVPGDAEGIRAVLDAVADEGIGED